MCRYPFWEGPACVGQCDGGDGKVSPRVPGFALFVGQRVGHSSMGA